MLINTLKQTLQFFSCVRAEFQLFYLSGLRIRCVVYIGAVRIFFELFFYLSGRMSVYDITTCIGRIAIHEKRVMIMSGNIKRMEITSLRCDDWIEYQGDIFIVTDVMDMNRRRADCYAHKCVSGDLSRLDINLRMTFILSEVVKIC